MATIKTSPSSDSHHLKFASVMVVLSVVLPIAIAVVSTVIACWEEPLGVLGPGWRDYEGGSLRHGELWYAIRRSGSTEASRIRRLDLSTGTDRDSGFGVDFHRQAVYPRWIGDQLYLVGWNFMSGNSLFRVENGIVKSLGLMPAGTAMIRISDIFDYEGQVTTVIETAPGEFRLIHLRDGHWENGRRIRLPEPDLSDSKTVDKTAEGKLEVALRPQYTRRLSVVCHDGQTHLMFVRSSQDDKQVFRAYRNGFEFVDTEMDGNPHPPVSDLSTNAPGWETLSPEKLGFKYYQMDCDQKGLFFFGWTPETDEYCFVRRDFDGKWHPANVIKLPACLDDYKQVHLHSDNEGNKYIVRNAWSRTGPSWNKSEFFRLEGNSILGDPLVLDGDKRRFEVRYLSILAGFLLAWLIHIGLLFSAISAHERGQPMYEFGGRSIRLATSARRALAFLADFLIFSGIIAASWMIQAGILGVAWDRDPNRSLIGTLEYIEGNSFPLSIWTFRYLPGRIFDSTNAFGSPRDPLDFLAVVLLVFLNTGVPLLGYRAFRQGRHGVTPGKWLFGIRVLRSTLRPCGFFRAIVRDVVDWVDFPFLLTPLPAANSLFLSQRRQRLGDRIADTVVVVSHSIDQCAKDG